MLTHASEVLIRIKLGNVSGAPNVGGAPRIVPSTSRCSINGVHLIPKVCPPLAVVLKRLKHFTPFRHSCVYCKDQIRCKISKATSDFVNSASEQKEIQFQMPFIPASAVDANSSRLSLRLMTP